MVGLDDVRAAEARLAGIAHRTQVLTSRTLDRRVGASILLKAEVFQRSGSFKFRGAYNKLASLTPAQRDAGVLAFSSGNHAQAVALAASIFRTGATVVMPSDAPEGKAAATRAYGAAVITYDRYTEDREEIGRRLAEKRNLTLVPPFDDPQVIAGQGTAGLELVQDAGPLDVLLAPVSGGGLIAGCAVAVKGLGSGTRVIGVEPETADDYRQSLLAGSRITIPVPRTVADALQVAQPGELTFAHNQALLHSIVTVSDAELIGAMRFCHERLKLVVEPGGVAGLAALLAGAVQLAPAERVGVILSGGNVDPERFCRLLHSISS
ncbi:MAG TPA: pyridoxal-phosphate dependent enzyme [Solirubrobacteraceae bacterium]|nr:pyridoxal-phosphate dependent enzyme [Solirubrobacteraceae bacterium]